MSIAEPCLCYALCPGHYTLLSFHYCFPFVPSLVLPPTLTICLLCFFCRPAHLTWTPCGPHTQPLPQVGESFVCEGSDWKKVLASLQAQMRTHAINVIDTLDLPPYGQPRPPCLACAWLQTHTCTCSLHCLLIFRLQPLGLWWAVVMTHLSHLPTQAPVLCLCSMRAS